MITHPALRAILTRELVRIVRQPARVVAALGTPLLIWAFFAGGFASAFAPGGGADTAPDYAAFLLPGAITLSVTFSSIFSALSLIEDRNSGFLQGALVSPAPPWTIAIGKSLGGAGVALAQAAILLVAAPLVGAAPGATGYLLALLAVALTSLGVTGVSLAFAWRIRSSEGFHGVMNLVIMPMWLLSGAVFDIATAAPWLRALATLNPLAHATTAMRSSLLGSVDATALSWTATVLFAALGCAAAVGSMLRASRPGRANNHA